MERKPGLDGFQAFSDVRFTQAATEEISRYLSSPLSSCDDGQIRCLFRYDRMTDKRNDGVDLYVEDSGIVWATYAVVDVPDQAIGEILGHEFCVSVGFAAQGETVTIDFHNKRYSLV